MKRNKHPWHLICSLLLTGSASLAQDATIFPPVQPQKTISAVQIFNSLTIDGRLDEADWQLAPTAQNFFQVQPNQGLPLRFDTRVKVMYNRKFLYVGAFCPDSLGRRGIRVPDLRRDFDYFENDLFAVIFDPFQDKRNSQSFQTNPFGAQRDLITFDDAFYDREWDGYWKVRTTRTDSGWVAEMQVPWKTLRYPRTQTDSAGATWGVNFNRIARRLGERSVWSPVPRAYDVYRMPYAGVLTGLKPPPPSVNIRVQPYTLVSYDRIAVNGQTLDDRTRLNVGGELKWAISPQTILDLTFNTDFAQADADRQVQNLTRFSVFFPERRQFFLENASLFIIGDPGSLQPFFSRRIGLSDDGNPIPLDAGVRLVSRTSRYSAGGLFVRQRSALGLPGATFAVGRYSRNLGQQHRIGGLVTSRFDGADPQGQTVSNQTYSVDGFFRITQPLSWDGMVSRSQTSGAEGNGGPSHGWSALSRFRYSTNQWYLFYFQNIVTKNYRPGTGFVYGTNVINTNFGGYRMWRPNWRPASLRQLDPGVFVNIFHRASDGRFQQAELELFPLYLIGVKGWSVEGYVVPTWQRLDEPFAPLGIRIAPSSYQYTRYRFYYGNDQSRKLAYSLFHEGGRYYDGKLQTWTATLRYSPVPQVSMAMEYTRNIARELGELRQNRTTELITPQLRLAVNPRLQLIGFYQKNTAVNRDVWNVRLAWEFQPLSFLYIVYNSNGNQLYDNALQRTNLNRADQVIGKLTYLKQF
ncbi:hypothetical protein BN8_04341 [Fibrisoma limi BUZ 3]|uniref:Uncharacterized protein n=1 Tax=Fibrisoma limi BUZ 3 TaxID=1185876 RepID=I2GMH8_9BACT|nr:carbohydrate binding family 9 domain-containing protein [Fibrisoma limi]CCH55106.1 hypothetical protein BN8_04341 [Fibrisoma limi BUZ 3]